MVDSREYFEEIKNLIITTQKQVLNIDELCAFTGLSKSTIYKGTMNGTIPHFKQLKHLWFDKDEIIQFLKQNRGNNVSELQETAATALSMKGGAK